MRVGQWCKPHLHAAALVLLAQGNTDVGRVNARQGKAQAARLQRHAFAHRLNAAHAAYAKPVKAVPGQRHGAVVAAQKAAGKVHLNEGNAQHAAVGYGSLGGGCEGARHG